VSNFEGSASQNEDGHGDGCMTVNTACCALDSLKLQEKYRAPQVGFCEERSIEADSEQFPNFDVNV
jgi:hypothetical protein